MPSTQNKLFIEFTKTSLQDGSLHSFSRIIGFKPKALAYILYKMPLNEKYSEFTVPKKNGETRLIYAPEKRLKKLQNRLAHFLYDYCSNLENNKNRRVLSHGFTKEKSIHTNAYTHKNRKYVLNFDIQDFFPSINFGRVRGYFIKNKNFNCSKKIATIIAQIACHNNQLPQGSPCSPVISNLIAHLLDIYLVQLAKKYKLTYSRYADDITFSTNQKKFPEEIAIQDSKDPTIWHVSEIVKNQVSRSGFKINQNKTRMRYRDFRQTVTGLVVNKTVNVRSEYYKLARAMTHSLFVKGHYYTPSKISPVDILDKAPISNNEADPKRLEGMLNHILYTRKFPDKKNKEKKELTGISKLFKDFLFFKNFLIPKKPVIICEGPTDPIYIKLSLKKMIDKYPKLIEKNNNRINYNISFLNRSKGNLKKVLQLSGGDTSGEGTGSLLNVINIYERQFKKYSAWKKPKHPIIILTDNDKGVKKLFKEISKKYNTKIEIDSDKNFFYICKNLYLIKTPHINQKKETCIEDLFDQKWLESFKYNGKTFPKESKKNHKEDIFNNCEHYGKMILATKVLPQNLSSVDFTGFQQLLNRLVQVIEHYKNK